MLGFMFLSIGPQNSSAVARLPEPFKRPPRQQSTGANPSRLALLLGPLASSVNGRSLKRRLDPINISDVARKELSPSHPLNRRVPTRKQPQGALKLV